MLRKAPHNREPSGPNVDSAEVEKPNAQTKVRPCPSCAQNPGVPTSLAIKSELLFLWSTGPAGLSDLVFPHIPSAYSARLLSLSFPNNAKFFPTSGYLHLLVPPSGTSCSRHRRPPHFSLAFCTFYDSPYHISTPTLLTPLYHWFHYQTYSIFDSFVS